RDCTQRDTSVAGNDGAPHVHAGLRVADGVEVVPLLLLRFVARGGLAVVGDVVGGPEEAAGDQVEVAGVFDRLVVVADRGGEDAGLAVVLVGPGDDVVVGALLA